MLQQSFSLGELYSQLKQLNSSQDRFTGLYGIVEYSYASIIQIRSLREFSFQICEFTEKDMPWFKRGAQKARFRD